jgi:AGCS family alanine or glycine:cation symporter
LFGSKTIILYKYIFLAFIIMATIANTGTMVDFASILFLSMAVPNILGLFVMSGDVKKMLNEYMAKLKSGELDREVLK